MSCEYITFAPELQSERTVFFEVCCSDTVDFLKYEPLIAFLMKEGQTFKETFYVML